MKARWAGGAIVRRHDYGWYQLRREVLKRDNFTCQKCGYRGNYTVASNGRVYKSKKQDRLLHTHHIMGYRYETSEADTLEKLITLCAKCHTAEEWQIYKKHREEPFVFEKTQKDPRRLRFFSRGSTGSAI